MTDHSPTIYSVGSSNRSAQEFIHLLTHYGIQCLIDVRRFPISKFDYFKKENLSRLCRQSGIDYLWMGNSLGGYRKGGYESYMLTEEFRSALQEVQRIGHRKRTAICCSERFPWKCHRRFIGQALERQGWRVVHIIDIDYTWQPTQKELF